MHHSIKGTMLNACAIIISFLVLRTLLQLRLHLKNIFIIKTNIYQDSYKHALAYVCDISWYGDGGHIIIYTHT